MTMQLLRGRVAIRPLEPRYHGVLVLPDTAYDTERATQKSRGLRAQSSHRGRVLALGPPARTAKGDAPVPHGFVVGDEVVFVYALSGTEQSRTSTWTDGEPVVWIAQEEVIAVVDDWKCPACDRECRCANCGAPCNSQCDERCELEAMGLW